jgi:hypothetical protein
VLQTPDSPTDYLLRYYQIIGLYVANTLSIIPLFPTPWSHDSKRLGIQSGFIFSSSSCELFVIETSIIDGLAVCLVPSLRLWSHIQHVTSIFLSQAELPDDKKMAC